MFPAGTRHANASHLSGLYPFSWNFFEYGMSFDAKKDDDQILESNGVSFLIDATSLEYLDGSVVDFDDGLGGKGFDIRNPNASSTCGCGRSFN